MVRNYFDGSVSDDFRALVTRVLYLPHEAYIALVILYCVVLLPVVCLIFQLFHFHLTIMRLQTTTYDFMIDTSNNYAKKKKDERKKAAGRSGGGGAGANGRGKQVSECGPVRPTKHNTAHHDQTPPTNTTQHH